MTERWKQSPKVAVVGGGLAGLAAGSALAESGFRVSLFERRAYLGGRASSYQHPGTGEVVDNCQHVLLGCCTNLIEFYRRIGVEDKIRWYERMTFLEPGGRASVIKPSTLPAPLHTAPAFLRASCLNFTDKLSIAAGLAALAPMAPRDTGESFLKWLRRHGQTERAIDRFWKTVLVSALNEEINLISVPYAAQVMRESFLKSRTAGRMGVPTVPLTELYNRAGDYMMARAGEVRFRAAAESFRAEFADVKLILPGGEESFDFACSSAYGARFSARVMSQSYGQAFHSGRAGGFNSHRAARHRRILPEVAAPPRANRACHRSFLEDGAGQRAE